MTRQTTQQLQVYKYSVIHFESINYPTELTQETRTVTFQNTEFPKGRSDMRDLINKWLVRVNAICYTIQD